MESVPALSSKVPCTEEGTEQKGIRPGSLGLKEASGICLGQCTAQRSGWTGRAEHSPWLKYWQPCELFKFSVCEMKSLGIQPTGRVAPQHHTLIS